jgi:hypothetical protein
MYCLTTLTSGRQGGDVLQQLGLGHTGVTHEADVDVTSDLHAVAQDPVEAQRTGYIGGLLSTSTSTVTALHARHVRLLFEPRTWWNRRQAEAATLSSRHRGRKSPALWTHKNTRERTEQVVTEYGVTYQWRMRASSRDPHPLLSQPPNASRQAIRQSIVRHNLPSVKILHWYDEIAPGFPHNRKQKHNALVLTMAACSSRSASSAEYSCFCFSTSKASMNVSACSPAVIARNPVYFTC